MHEIDWTGFFRDYAEANHARDAARVAAFYADGFLVAAPAGSSTFKNDEAFLAWLEALFRFNAQVGMTSLDVAGTEVSKLDARYRMVAVDWVARFRQLGDERVPFRITYIVGLSEAGRPKILGYISHEDQVEEMKRRGLAIPT